MDVELQILKHLARDPHPTVTIIDEYCAEYKDLFKEVRNYKCFKYEASKPTESRVAFVTRFILSSLSSNQQGFLI